MAAGFRLPADRFEAFAASLTAKLEPEIASARRSQTYHLDGAIGPAGAHAVALAIERLAPFGVGNPEPRFALPAMRRGYQRLAKWIDGLAGVLFTGFGLHLTFTR